LAGQPPCPLRLIWPDDSSRARLDAPIVGLVLDGRGDGLGVQAGVNGYREGERDGKGMDGYKEGHDVLTFRQPAEFQQAP
jgi:hypothetical protein